MEIDSNSSFQLPPGFRFHPSDEELINHYLLNKLKSRPLPASVIAEIELYNYNPWELPKKALFGEDEWYFFSPRDRKYPNGERPNRTAASGYWKATGTDKPILASSGSRRIGVKKALVFYTGRPPNGVKTDWIMNEYRLPETMRRPSRLKGSMRLDDWVLCRVRQKGNMSKNIWEVQESPSKELVEYLPNIVELPSVHTQSNKDIVTDYLFYKDHPVLAPMLANQAPPATETILSASFHCGNNVRNCGSVYEDGSHKGNSSVTVSFFDSIFNPSNMKLNNGNSYEPPLLSTKMVTNDRKNEDQPANTSITKVMNLSSQNQSQGEIYNFNLLNAIIIPQKFDESVFTGRVLQQ